jgi:hypothetical protein
MIGRGRHYSEGWGLDLPLVEAFEGQENHTAIKEVKQVKTTKHTKQGHGNAPKRSTRRGGLDPWGVLDMANPIDGFLE